MKLVRASLRSAEPSALRLALAGIVIFLSFAAVAQSSPASGPQTLYTQSLAATCANCHGTQGRAVEGSSILSLAGLDKSYIAAQMHAFKTGTRPATVMHQISKGYSDAQIDSLAAYFSAQKK